MKKIHFLMAFSMIGMQMLAQTTTKDSVQLDEVVVTGSKVEISRKVVPISGSQISKQEIENTGNIKPLLSYKYPRLPASPPLRSVSCASGSYASVVPILSLNCILLLFLLMIPVKI